MTKKPITGRHVLLFMVGAFGLIITVNFTMAYMAVSTFPGVETRNSYTASQNFQNDRAAQLALNWDVKADVVDDQLVIAITDQAGQPVQVAEITATLGRATHVNDDQFPTLVFRDGVYTAPAEIGPGNWNVRMLARAEDGTKFRQRIVIYRRPDA
ncbi:MAG: FixH family protein [Pseudomonadota bacterium]